MNNELVFFSQYKLGGVQNYYKAIISGDTEGRFDKTWILTHDQDDPAALPTAEFNVCRELRFDYRNDDPAAPGRLSKLIPSGKGLVMTNFHLELTALSRYPRPAKTIVHVCHDDFFLSIAVGFAFIIDAFVAHNPFYFSRLKELLPGRQDDIYYMPYGISPSPHARSENNNEPLKIIFLARFDKKKGVYDLFQIDDELKRRGTRVRWTLVGDGPEKKELEERVAERDNFQVFTIPHSADVFLEAAKNDVFILPSYLDGLPVALLETMSAGLVPVISEFNGGIKTVVGSDLGYVLPVGDTRAFADTLGHLDANRNLLDTMGGRAKDRILKDYNIAARAQDYYTFFNRFASLKRSDWYKFSRHIRPSRFAFYKFQLNRKRKTLLGNF